MTIIHFAIERANDVMNYMVKSYFAIDERNSGTWKEEGYFSSIDDAKNFISNKKNQGSWAEYYIYEYRPAWVLV